MAAGVNAAEEPLDDARERTEELRDEDVCISDADDAESDGARCREAAAEETEDDEEASNHPWWLNLRGAHA